MSITLKERQKYELKNFRGFDFSSSALNVSTSRGCYGKNFIFENGVNRKRKGYEELFRIKIKENEIVTYPRIDGIYKFTLSQKEFIICYAGKHFFSVEKLNDNYDVTDITFTSTLEKCKLSVNDLISNRLFMFKNNNTVYFVGAGKYICFKKYGENFELRYVEGNEDTYIPTTSINITPREDIENVFEPYEERNILNDYVINNLIPKVSNNSDTMVFDLDSTYVDNTKDIEVSIKTIKDNETKEIILKNKNNDENLFYNNVNYGTIKSNGEFTLTNTDSGLGEMLSIKVKFSVGKSLLLEEINKCTIATTFGVNGRMDRLFISKNGIKINQDYYSESEDFTYFGENSVNQVGSQDSPIMSYMLLNDGTLAIQKKHINGEIGIFYRNGIYDIKYDNKGLIEYINTYFPIKSGTIGEGVVSSYTNCNLGDDKLFLSSNGVYSLTLPKNLSTSERYAKERSIYINSRLKAHKDLSQAVAINYENKYYLAIDDSVYIADPRFISNSVDNLTDTYNYEWWYWDNIGARVWSVIDNQLWFGRNDGRVCVFDNTYTDKIYKVTNQGDIMIDYNLNKIVFNSSYGDLDDMDIIFTCNVYAEGITSEDIIKIEDNKIYIKDEKLYHIKNGQKVLSISVANELIKYGEYIISDIDYVNKSFKLKYEGNEVSITDSNINLELELKGEKLRLVFDDDKYRVCFDYSGEVLKFVSNGISSQLVTAKILEKAPVKCEWYTPMMDFGNSEVSKTLLKISLTTSEQTNGKLTFGYKTKDCFYETQGKGISSFSFDNIDFTNFSFNTSFANSYTIDLKEDFNYIQFYFRSDTPTDCVIENVAVIYKNNRFNRDVE